MGFWIFALAVWLIVLVTIPGAARRRGRDPGGWFLLAVFIGLFAPLLLLLAGPTEVRRIEEEETIRRGLQGTSSATAQLKELGELKASGVLTDEEFDAKKAILLERI